jgi:alpha-amylase
VNETEGKSTAFDFTTKGILQEAVNGQLWRLRDRNSKPPGMIGYWPEKAVTFIDNHDTGSTQGHWPFPGDKVMQGYAYILTHPGTPCIVSSFL